MPPLVTIGIPCYNAAQWIAASVQSALDQSWDNKEIIVVDDGSTDETVEILQKFGSAIRVERAAHGGANRARNLILRSARGEWLQYLDADDYLRVEKIGRQVEEAGGLEAIENVDVIYSPVLIEEWKDGQPLPLSAESIDTDADLCTQLLRWQLPQTSGALWRKKALEEIGGWDETATQLCDEHDCYFRAMKAGKSFVFAPSPNAVYRIWSETTRCHQNQGPVIKSRTALCEELREWLLERGMWAPAHQAALGQSFLEMARKLASEDLTVGARYHRAHKGDIRLAGPAAPGTYQLIYRMLGFRAAEMLARTLR